MDLEKTENPCLNLSHDQMLYLLTMRQTAWDMFASAALGMSMHPGTTRDKARPLTVDEVARIADDMMVERDKRFGGLL